MNKTIEIGGSQWEFASDGALPIVYRQLFPKKSFFIDIQKADKEPEIILDFAFAMAYNADAKRTGTNELRWLKTISDNPFDLIYNHGDELTDLISADMKVDDQPDTGEESTEKK